MLRYVFFVLLFWGLSIGTLQAEILEEPEGLVNISRENCKLATIRVSLVGSINYFSVCSGELDSKAFLAAVSGGAITMLLQLGHPFLDKWMNAPGYLSLKGQVSPEQLSLRRTVVKEVILSSVLWGALVASRAGLAGLENPEATSLTAFLINYGIPFSLDVAANFTVAPVIREIHRLGREKGKFLSYHFRSRLWLLSSAVLTGLEVAALEGHFWSSTVGLAGVGVAGSAFLKRKALLGAGTRFLRSLPGGCRSWFLRESS